MSLGLNPNLSCPIFLPDNQSFDLAVVEEMVLWELLTRMALIGVFSSVPGYERIRRTRAANIRT